MHLTTQELPVQNLRLGMYVSRLDVPWVQTPFPIQGFYLTKQDELDLLSHYCNKVYIDVFLSKTDALDSLKKLPESPKKTDNQLDAKTIRLMNEKARFKPRVENYSINSKINKEMKVASQLFERITAQMTAVYRALEHNGYVNINEISNASASMVKSIINNPNAFAWLSRINRQNDTLQQQSVRSAIWALIFARHLGLSRSDLKDIGTALLLAPIGKSKLDPQLLTQQSSADDLEAYQKHVEYTLEETQNMFSSNHQVNYILSSYCERNNGSGYPNKLVGNRIPFLARVVGIADYYEHLINPYNNDDAITPAEAVSHLYNNRGNLFQVELVESFIQAIGLYPTGSLVSLNNNAIAVVVEQPEKSRLRPRVAIIKNHLDEKLEKPITINLASKPKDEFGLTLQISSSLTTSSQDIDAREIHQKVFANKSWFNFINI
jgi:HD-GYP domain-containing protein (c-di-GMP phosphodiesterase class II)